MDMELSCMATFFVNHGPLISLLFVRDGGEFLSWDLVCVHGLDGTGWDGMEWDGIVV